MVVEVDVTGVGSWCGGGGAGACTAVADGRTCECTGLVVRAGSVRLLLVT